MTAFSGQTDAPKVRCDLTDTHTHRQTDKQTDRHDDYRNPRCACAPRVNHASAWRTHRKSGVVRQRAWFFSEFAVLAKHVYCKGSLVTTEKNSALSTQPLPQPGHSIYGRRLGCSLLYAMCRQTFPPKVPIFMSRKMGLVYYRATPFS